MQETQELQVQFLGKGRSPGGGNGNPLQYPCLITPMDRRAWQAAVHRIIKSQIPLSNWAHHTHTHVIWNLNPYCLVQASSVSKSCLTLCDPMDNSLPGSSVHEISHVRVGYHFLLQGIFPTQGSNLRLLCLPHWQEDSLPMNHLGSSKLFVPTYWINRIVRCFFWPRSSLKKITNILKVP